MANQSEKETKKNNQRQREEARARVQARKSGKQNAKFADNKLCAIRINIDQKRSICSALFCTAVATPPNDDIFTARGAQIR